MPPTWTHQGQRAMRKPAEASRPHAAADGPVLDGPVLDGLVLDGPVLDAGDGPASGSCREPGVPAGAGVFTASGLPGDSPLTATAWPPATAPPPAAGGPVPPRVPRSSGPW